MQRLKNCRTGIVIGDKEIETKKVTLENREKGQIGQMEIEEVLKKLQKEIRKKLYSKN